MARAALIGREAERETLSGLLDSACSGRGASVLISGQAGIGKTALVDWLCRTAESRATVLRGAAVTGKSQPFLLISSAFDGHIEGPLFEDQEYVSFSQMLCITPSGMLVAKASESDGETDADIFAGMLTAVQSFVSDSFDRSGAESAGLGRLEYGNMKILIEHSRHMFLVAILEGREHPDMARTLRDMLDGLEREHGQTLASWAGSTSQVAPVEEALRAKIGTKFLVRKNLDDVRIESERIRIADSVLGTLAAMSAEKPVLLVLEDFHWSDESSAFALRFLARNICNRPIMLACTTRPADDGKVRPITEVLGEDSGAIEIHLEGLDAEGVGRMIASMYSPNSFPADMAERLRSHCAGNPFFVGELLRQMAADGTVVSEGGTHRLAREDFQIPASVGDIIRKRLDSLEPECLAMAEYLSCIGLRSDHGAAGSIGSIREPKRALERLEVSGIIRSAGDFLEFSHALFQAVIYEGISPRWRAAHHMSLGGHYESAHPQNPAEAAYELARHFSLTRAHSKSLKYSIMAAEKAEQSYAMEDAIGYYGTALGAISLQPVTAETPGWKVRILEGTADAKALIGRSGDSVADYRAALESAEERETKARLHRKISSCLFNLSDYDGSVSESQVCEEIAGPSQIESMRAKLQIAHVHTRQGNFSAAIDISRGVLAELDRNSHRDIAAASRMLGLALWYSGDYRGALESFEAGERSLEASGDMTGRARMLVNKGIVMLDLGDISKSVEFISEALEMYGKTGEQVGLASAHGSLSVAYQRNGDYANFKKHMLKGLEIYEKIGDRNGVSLSLCNYSIALNDIGEFSEALETAERAKAIAEKVGDFHTVTFSRYMRAGILREMGRNAEAMQLFREVLAQYTEMNNRQRMLGTNLAMGGIMKDMGDLEGAESVMRKCLEEGLALGDMEGTIEAKIELSGCLLACGKREEAMQVCAEALADAGDSGANIYLARAKLAMGEILSAAGDAAAQMHFAEAGQEFHRQGMSPSAARVDLAAGRDLLRRGDRAEGAELVGQALREAERMGMAGLEKEARIVSASFGLAPSGGS